MEDKQNGTEKRKKVRSPGFPAINLEAALQRAETFYDMEKRNSASFAIAASHWNFKEKSSGALQVVAALKSFGLLKDVEGGNTRRVQLTEFGLRIILDRRENSTERSDAIKKAALMPKMHAALWRKYGTSWGSDENLRHELIFDWKFNENTATDFIREYRETISFAKLTESDRLSESAENAENDESATENKTMEHSETTAQNNPVTPKPGSPGTPVRLRSYSWALSGELTAKLDLMGEPQSDEDLEALRDYVEITIKALGRSMRKAEQ